MHFTFYLLVSLLGVVTTAFATCFTTAGPASFKACCPTPQTSGKGTISGVVFKYTCGQFFKGDESIIGASSVKECAEECQKAPHCNSASWSAKQKCSLLGEKYPAPMKIGSWLTLQKTTEEPDPEQDCKELVDAAKREAESKCTTEKDRLQREAETQCRTDKDSALTNAALTNANAECQKDKDAALANANSQCATEKDKLRTEANTDAQQAQSKCTTEKDQLRQQADTARTQCQSEKDTALTNSNSQCAAEKEQLRQQLADAARQRDTERDGLQKQLKDAQDKAGASGGGFTESASAQDSACINNSWSSLCSGSCGHDTFTVGGVEFKRKCNVSTGGGREEQWLHRSSVMDCVRECAGIKACLGVGWIALQGHCHAHMTVSGSLRTAPSRGHPLHEHHLIYVPSRASVW
ncbi:hypothetical protein BKA65DRAFT_413212 [Rhexocercosporidium sp. MPI-PUGE-AT-0058]|nr:hypothetical protein BKA65DRAFT_413212 [Rhexocercosporidium sp. MPI-PUGE-AT-0058]